MSDLLKVQELLERRLNRERLARKEAERILEEKALELYQANKQLIDLNESLESEIEKRTEALRISRIRYKNLIETANEIIYEMTAEGYVTYANPISTTKLLYSNEEIVGNHFLNFISPDYRGRVVKHYQHCIDNKITSSYLEIPIRKKNKEILWVGQSVKLDFVTIEGVRQLVGAQAIARDITSRYYAQRKLELSEEKYRSIMENMELGFLEVDLQGRIVKAYDRFCQMSGYTTDELYGKSAIDTLLPEEYKEQMIQNDENRKGGLINSYEVELLKKSGERIWVLISGGPVFDEKGDTVGSVGIHYDISEQKRVQSELLKAKQIAENAQKSEQQFLANISHEIRTPLNAIIGMSHLLYDGNPTEEQREYLEMIKYSANFLHSLISDVLDMSKIEAGQVELKKNQFDIHELLRTIQKTFQLKTSDQEVEIILRVDASVNQFYVGDEVLLNQILMNVVGNAEKFTAIGNVTIDVTAIDNSDTSNLVFKIADSGIGIAEEKLSEIFQKFKQVHTKNQTNTKGTGLGLAIVKQLLELQNGEIAVTSIPGTGTTFTITIPYDNYIQAESENKGIPLAETVKDITELKILIVEDNPINQRYAGAVLKRLSINFDIAENGKVACEMSDEREYDMILLDIQMPIMNGYEAAAYIRNSGSPNKSIPLIALTASVMAIEHNKAIEAGMDDILSKPFTPAELKSMIEKYYIPAEKSMLGIESENETLTLDAKVISDTYDGDVEFQRIIFESFNEEISPQIEAFQFAYENQNLIDLANIAHQMKPTFGMVGFPKYQADLESIEKNIKQLNALPDQEEQLLKGFLRDVPKIKLTIKKAIDELS